MGESLQYAFVESRGKPVRVGKQIVTQADRVPIKKGRVRLVFLSAKGQEQGVYLKAKDGWVEMSDGGRTETLVVWKHPPLPDVVEHNVYCPSEGLTVWNAYRVVHPDGTVTEDMWTGNAGMVILEDAPQSRVYGCSTGEGDFDATQLVFRLEWFPDPL
jgi:hypothetical protein